MIYQEKPKEPKQIQALYIEENMSIADIAQWVNDINPLHLLKHFKTNTHGTAMYLSKHSYRIEAGMYLMYSIGGYGMLCAETFEELYEPMPEVPSEPGEVVEPEPPVEPEEPTDMESVTGIADPGAIITVTNTAGDVLGTAVADEEGNFTVILPPTNGQELIVTTTPPSEDKIESQGGTP